MISETEKLAMLSNFRVLRGILVEVFNDLLAFHNPLKPPARSSDFRLLYSPDVFEVEFAEIQNEATTWAADPFLYVHEEVTYILFEGPSPAEPEKGVIWRGKLSQLQHSQKESIHEASNFKLDGCQVVLEEPFHLSFPFTFAYEGQRYLIPESSKARKTLLYKLISEQGSPVQYSRFSLVNEVKPFPLVDTIIYEDFDAAPEERWVLEGSVDLACTQDWDLIRAVFRAPDPIGGGASWRLSRLIWSTPDLRGVRQGGGGWSDSVRERPETAESENGALALRVTQRSSGRQYGTGVSVERSKTSLESYGEKVLGNLENYVSSRLGHHLHIYGKSAVADVRAGEALEK